MQDTPRSTPRPLLWMVLVLIAYASLYPFAFHWRHLWEMLNRHWLTIMVHARSAPVDTVANLFFYIPLGFTLTHRVAPSRALAVRLLICTLIGLMVSFTLEVVQFAVPSRTPSLLDVLLNTLSTSLGVMLAIFYARIEGRWNSGGWLRQSRIDPIVAVMLIAWLCLVAAPFIPRLGIYRVWESLELVRHWEWSVSGTARWFASYLLMATTLRIVLVRDRFWWILWLALTVSFGAQIFFVQHRLEPDEIAGVIAALPVIALCRGVRTEKTLHFVGWLIVIGYVLYSLAPFDFSVRAQTFHWLPFTGLLESSVQDGFFSLVGKAYIYFGVLWIATLTGTRLSAASAMLFVIALALELLQIFLPGRVAEFTDPTLVIFSALVLSLARTRTAAGRDASVGYGENR
jgi:VanZ family protein